MKQQMLTPYMLDSEYIRASDVWSADFCDRFALDPFFNAFIPKKGPWKRKYARIAIRLHCGAADALYAQALIQATGALEEF